ncbi:MAG: pimeloyl-ACP methyl ester esterase BioH [Pseudomonadota bacterium]|nr:pimeloyl-ACP methyl ester esterase BioH [Pseudomonadota bacterium]
MSVHVESAGPDRGRPLVMLHGWAMHSGLWSPFLPRLVKRYRVHLVDLPGHGYSDPLPTPASLSGVVDAVELAVRDAAAPGRLFVLGWSLGGQVALEWARRGPERVGALALISTTPSFVQRPGWPDAMTEATLRRFGDELRVAYRPTLRRFATLQVQGSEQAPSALAALRSQLFARGEPAPRSLGDSLDLLVANDLRLDVGTISQPALVIAGDRDTITPVAASRWLAHAHPRASLVVVSGAAHAPFLSHPEQVAAALDAFADANPI